MKNKKYYTIYKVDKENGDITNIMDYETAEEVQKAYNLKNKKSIYHYLVKNIDDVDINNIKNLLNCKYFIMLNEE